MHAAGRSGHRLPELDALRGLAALAVGAYHLTWFVPFMVPGAPQAAGAVWWGCYGVQLFFAISGFVILGTLERTADVRTFVQARASRLLPEYWLAMTLTAAVAWVLGPDRLRVDAVTWALNLPMMHLWTGVRMVDGVYWSLSVEIGFYAAMALVWRLGWTPRIERVVLGWLAAKWTLAALAAPEWLRLLLLSDHAAYFATGLIGYRLWTGARTLRQEAPVLAAILGSAYLLDPVPWPIAVVMPLFLLLAAGRLRWLGRPGLVWMGAISYPFYLLHATIGYAVIVRLEAAGMDPLAAALAALVIGGLLATGLSRLVERLRRMRFAVTPATRHHRPRPSKVGTHV